MMTEICPECPLELLVQSERAARERIIDDGSEDREDV